MFICAPRNLVYSKSPKSYGCVAGSTAAVELFLLHFVSEYKRKEIGKNQTLMGLSTALYQRRTLGCENHFVFGAIHHSQTQLQVVAATWKTGMVRLALNHRPPLIIFFNRFVYALWTISICEIRLSWSGFTYLSVPRTSLLVNTATKCKRNLSIVFQFAPTSGPQRRQDLCCRQPLCLRSASNRKLPKRITTKEKTKRTTTMGTITRTKRNQLRKTQVRE